MATWSEYIIAAAQHSKGNAAHWFRYLGKIADKDVSQEEIDLLYRNERLTYFQRVSLKYAFVDGSPTRERVLGSSRKANLDMMVVLREKYEKIDSGKQ